MKCLTGLSVCCVLGAMLFCSERPVLAGSPTVVLSLKSVDELLTDADFIGESVGQNGLKAVLESTINGITGGADADGIDRERPFGLYWSMIENDPNNFGTVVAFVPITDEENFQKLISKFAPDLKVEDEKWTLSVQGIPLYAVISDEYCFVSSSLEGLNELSDPEKLANDDYDIAIDVNLSSIPQNVKDLFLMKTEEEGRRSLNDGPKPTSDAEARGQELGFDWMLATLKAVTNDGDRITFGVDFDGESHMASFDLGLTGVSKTPLANAMAVYGKTAPAFASVASESAALSLVMSHPTTGILDKVDELADAIRKSANAEIDKDPKLEDEADRKAAKDVANRLLSIGLATLKSGSLHSIIVLEKGAGGKARIVAGTKVAKGNDASKLWDDILKLSKESPDLAKVKSDAAKHAGARIHSILADADEKQAAMFGTEPLHLAIRADSLWFSLGGGNLEGLKTALDLSGKKGPQFAAPISLRLKPAALVSLLETDNKELIKRAEGLAGEPNDVLIVEIAPSKTGGVKVHLEFGVAIFSLFADKQ